MATIMSLCGFPKNMSRRMPEHLFSFIVDTISTANQKTKKKPLFSIPSGCSKSSNSSLQHFSSGRSKSHSTSSTFLLRNQKYNIIGLFFFFFFFNQKEALFYSAPLQSRYVQINFWIAVLRYPLDSSPNFWPFVRNHQAW